MLQNTGERFLSGVNRGVIRYEHLHRYALCTDLVRGKDVLDVACGEGYGTAMLAASARSVVGVDVAQEAVEFARRHYYHHNARFLVGDCTALPVADHSVDFVVSFETIEHHDRHDEMMAEIRRVLRPGGILVISSPNRLVYSDEPDYSNPFHVKELYFDEFAALLQRHFEHAILHGQRLAAASFVYPLVAAQDGPVMPYVGTVERVEQRLSSLKSPVYFIALCSDDRARIDEMKSLFIDAEDDLFRMLDSERRGLADQVQELTRRLDEAMALPIPQSLPMLGASSEPEDSLRPPLPVEGASGEESAVLTSQLEALAAELEAERTASSALRAQLGDLSIEREALAANTDTLQEHCAELNAKLTSVQAERDRLVSEIVTLQNACAEVEDRLLSVTAKNRSTLASLEERVRHQASTLHERSAEVAMLERRAQHQARAISVMVDDEALLRDQLRAATALIAQRRPSSLMSDQLEKDLLLLEGLMSSMQRELYAARKQSDHFRDIADEAMTRFREATGSRSWRIANRIRNVTRRGR